MLSLNAAYAVVEVCDALEHTSGHTAHSGHHNHEHSDDHVHAFFVPIDDFEATITFSYHHKKK